MPKMLTHMPIGPFFKPDAQAAERAGTRQARAHITEVSGLAVLIAMASGASADGIARGIGAVKAALFLLLIEALVWLSMPAIALLKDAAKRERPAEPVASPIEEPATPMQIIAGAAAMTAKAGTKADYLQRLQREHPGLAAKIASGEMSVYAASIAARLRKAAARATKWTRSPTHKPHPDSRGGQFDESEIVGVVLFEAGGDGSEVLQPVEETLDEIAKAVKEGAESRDIDASRHRFDIGPGAAVGQILAQRIAVIGTVSQEDLPLANVAQHVGGASAVMRLAFRQLQSDRQAVGVDKGVDLRGQTAP